MSMLGNFRQISPRLLERIKAKPSLVPKVVRYRPDGDAPASDAEAFLSLVPAHMRKAIESMPPEARADFLAQLSAGMADMPGMVKEQIAALRQPKPAPRSSKAEIAPADVGAELDIEKAWHGVHFLLCGSADRALGPLGTAVLGGKELGADLGYGPARYLESSEVTMVADALAPLTREAVAERFDAGALEQNNIYPSGWAKDDDRREWLVDALSELQAFYQAAADGGYAMLLWIA